MSVNIWQDNRTIVNLSRTSWRPNITGTRYQTLNIGNVRGRNQLAWFENGQATLEEITCIDWPQHFKSRVNLRPATLLFDGVDDWRKTHGMLVQRHDWAQQDPSLIVARIAVAWVLRVQHNGAIVIALQVFNSFWVAETRGLTPPIEEYLIYISFDTCKFHPNKFRRSETCDIEPSWFGWKKCNYFNHL